MSKNIYLTVWYCCIFMAQLVILGSLTTPVAAQRAEYGVKAGLNLGSVIGPIEKNASGKLVAGLNAGLFTCLPIKNRWSVLSEINYSRKGADFSQESKTGESHFDIPEMGWKDFPAPYTAFNLKGFMHLHYLETPIMLQYRAGSKVAFGIGPQIAWLLKGKSEITQDIYVGIDSNYPLTVFEDTTVILQNHLHRLDWGATAGVRFQNQKKISGSLRISSSLTSIYRKELAELKDNFLNVFLTLSLGYRISKL